MSRPSSSFLRGANFGSSGGRVPDEASVLSALGNLKSTDLFTLAEALNANPKTVQTVVDRLRSRQMIMGSEKRLWLSAAGQRAMRYTKSAGR